MAHGQDQEVSRIWLTSWLKAEHLMHLVQEECFANELHKLKHGWSVSTKSSIFNLFPSLLDGLIVAAMQLQ